MVYMWSGLYSTAPVNAREGCLLATFIDVTRENLYA